MGSEILEKIFSEIEKFIGFPLPSIYKNFVNQLDENDYDYFYPLSYIIERNTTYAIQSEEPNALLIGQDGDLGFYLQANQGDIIFNLGLGALGSLALEFFADNIQNAIKRIEKVLLDDE